MCILLAKGANLVDRKDDHETSRSIERLPASGAIIDNVITMRIIHVPPDNEFQVNEPLFAKLVAGDGLLLKHLQQNCMATGAFFLDIPEARLAYRYAPGKWTIREIIMHLIDMERVYSYRMLRFARNDQTPLPGFDADRFISFSGANERTIKSLVDEFGAVRMATIALLNGLPDAALLRSGTMNGHLVSVRAMAYHIAGHELHHVSIVKEKYLR